MRFEFLAADGRGFRFSVGPAVELDISLAALAFALVLDLDDEVVAAGRTDRLDFEILSLGETRVRADDRIENREGVDEVGAAVIHDESIGRQEAGEQTLGLEVHSAATATATTTTAATGDELDLGRGEHEFLEGAFGLDVVTDSEIGQRSEVLEEGFGRDHDFVDRRVDIEVESTRGEAGNGALESGFTAIGAQSDPLGDDGRAVDLAPDLQEVPYGEIGQSGNPSNSVSPLTMTSYSVVALT